MKNFFKVLGIIALVAVIGFSAISCGDDKKDDTTGQTPGGQTPGGQTPGGSGFPEGAYTATGITVDSALVGTWKGDEDNGILIFTSTGVGTTDTMTSGTNGYSFAAAMVQVKLAYSTGTVTLGSGKLTLTVSGFTVNMFEYVITGTNLKIYEYDDDEGRGDLFYEGTKQ